MPFFCFLLLSMIYLMVSTVTENSFKMIPHYLQQCITLTKHQMIWIWMIWITKWSSQWKMCFNLDISKQAHEFFSRNRSIAFHPPLTFNNIPVAQTNYQKYLGMHLDNTAQKMKFSIEDFFSKCAVQEIKF